MISRTRGIPIGVQHCGRTGVAALATEQRRLPSVVTIEAARRQRIEMLDRRAVHRWATQVMDDGCVVARPRPSNSQRVRGVFGNILSVGAEGGRDATLSPWDSIGLRPSAALGEQGNPARSTIAER